MNFTGKHDDIMAMAGYWEPIAFVVRGGRGVKGLEQDSFPYSEEMARKLAGIGINIASWHYYKGLGIRTEEEEMQRTTQFFRILDNYGIIKSVYINLGSFFADTFLDENPQAEQWLSIDQFGLPHQYSEYYRCYYRLRPCMSRMAFAEYVGAAAVKAIREAGAEHILFDNSAQMPCYCDACRQGFPAYALEKFPERPGEGQVSFKERFGYAFKGRFELPRGNYRRPIDNVPAAHEPGLYEWVRYRQEQYERAHRRATEMIRSESGDVTISWNIALDYGEFTGMVWGIDPETAYRCKSDYFFSEDDNCARIENGRLISHIRTFRYGRAMNNRVLVHNILHGTEDQKYLSYVEAAVFNDGCLGCVMWATDEEAGLDTLKHTIAFLRANKAMYVGTKPVSRIAVYRCSESETAGWADVTLSRYAVEQVLIKHSIPFDYVINDTLDNIFDYELLVCANTMNVSDATLEKIAAFVRKGGKLLCSEGAFFKDEYGRKRISVSDMGYLGERDGNVGRIRNSAEGAGRILAYLGLDRSYGNSVFYLYRIDHAVPYEWNVSSGYHTWLGNEYYVEPRNKDDIVALLRQALPERDLELEAPDNVIGALFGTREAGHVVHLLDFEAGRELAGVKVRVRAAGCDRSHAIFKTIEGERSVPLSLEGNVMSCIVPAFKTYGFLQI